MMGYEGTPALWHLLLFPLAKAGLPYVSMRILHLLIAVGAATVFLFAAPFPRWEKGLVIFGYFPLYEYNAIARNYALAVLLLFGIAACWERRRERPGRVCLLIALLAQTSVHALLLAAPLALLLTYDLAAARSRAERPAYVAGALLMVLSFGAAVYQVRPPPDLQPGTAGWHLDLAQQLQPSFERLLNAFLPVPQLQIHFWRTRLVAARLRLVPLLLLTVALLWKRPRVLLTYLLCTLLLLGLFAAKYAGGIRHHGMIYLAFLTCLWLAHRYPGSGPVIHPWLRPALIGLLSLQVLAAVPAVGYDTRYDFSAGERVARYLQDEGLLEGHPLIATYLSWSGESVLAPLDRPDLRFFHIETEEYGTFGVWTQNYYSHLHMTPAAVMSRLDREVRRTEPATALLIQSAPPVGPPEPLPSGRYQLLARFEPTIASDESFYLYRVR